MPISSSFAFDQVMRLSGLPYFGQLSPQAIEELVSALSTARNEAEAKAAITALITDQARASSPISNRVPSPGEILAWLESERDNATRYWEPPPRPAFCTRCGGEGKAVPWNFMPVKGSTLEQQWEAMEAAKVPCPDCTAVVA
jgi:hypothetical protein